MPEAYNDDADTVAGIARAVPGVTALHAGMFGEVATYLPGRRVTGVRVTDGHIDVHLIIAADAKVIQTAAAVRRAVADAFPSHAVDVTVEDIATGPRRTTPPPSGSTHVHDTGEQR